MAATTGGRMQKVRKLSASLRNLFLLVFVLSAAVWLVMTIIAVSDNMPPPPGARVRIGNAQYSAESVSDAVRAMGLLYSTLSAAIFLKLMFHLMRLFGLYADGKIFSAENVQQIRQVGITLLLFPALWVLGLFLPLLVPGEALSEAVTSGGPPAFLQFIGAVQQLIFGSIVILISWIMDVGRELREEQELVV